MKKFYIPYIVFCIILLSLFIININSAPKKNPIEYKKEYVKAEKKSSEIKNDAKDIKAESSYYTVKASENDIFLYDKNNNVIEKLDIDYSNLRQYDKNQFIKGIRITSMDDVYILLEDFSN